MKTLTTLLLLLPLWAFSQTQIGYNYLEEVDTKTVQPFINETLAMSLQSDTSQASDGIYTFSYTYVDKSQANEDAQTLTVTYTAFNFDGDFVIQQATITGGFDRVVQFYTRFWDTALKFNEGQDGELIINHYGPDRVAFTPQGKEATITITSKAYESPKHYLKEWQ